MGIKNCVFCGKDESADHLFFACPAASLIWILIKCTFGLRRTPMSMQECLGSWLNSFGKEDKKLVLVGISATCWALWKARNGVIF